MKTPPEIAGIGKRRIKLWRKGVKVGLTDCEMNEYRRLHRRVMRYIRRTATAAEWKAVQALSVGVPRVKRVR